jgi:branched-chain amino acid transport system ATP-binding protein
MNGLSVKGLSAWYGKGQALFDVDLEVKPSEVVGLIGRNGAGKSTTLRSIARLHKNVRGSIALDDKEFSQLAPYEAARSGISLVGETAPVFAKLSVEENLRLAQALGRRRHVEWHSLDDAWSWFPPLYEARRRPAGVLSGGQRRMLALSLAFVSEPRLMLLDEPSGGLSDDVAETVFGVIEAVCGEGRTVLISEQRPELLERFVPRVYVLDEGVVVSQRLTAVGRARTERLKGEASDGSD